MNDQVEHLHSIWTKDGAGSKGCYPNITSGLVLGGNVRLSVEPWQLKSIHFTGSLPSLTPCSAGAWQRPGVIDRWLAS